MLHVEWNLYKEANRESNKKLKMESMEILKPSPSLYHHVTIGSIMPSISSVPCALSSSGWQWTHWLYPVMTGSASSNWYNLRGHVLWAILLLPLHMMHVPCPLQVRWAVALLLLLCWWSNTVLDRASCIYVTCWAKLTTWVYVTP